MSYSLLAGSGHPDPARKTVRKPVWHIPFLYVQWKIPDDGQSNCPKHVEFYSKNKFEKLMHLVGFIIRIYHDARPPECQIHEMALWSHVYNRSLGVLHLQDQSIGRYHSVPDVRSFYLKILWTDLAIYFVVLFSSLHLQAFFVTAYITWRVYNSCWGGRRVGTFLQHGSNRRPDSQN